METFTIIMYIILTLQALCIIGVFIWVKYTDKKFKKLLEKIKKEKNI